MGKYGRSEEIVQRVERERTALWEEFDRIKDKLVEIARYIYPGALAGLVRDVRNLTAESQYDEDDADRLTGVPFDAFRVAVSGFYTNLTNPSSPWFRLGTPSFAEREEDDEDWLCSQYAKLTRATQWLMGWCGSYRALHMCYKHLVAFGFAALLAEEDDERIVRVTCLRMGTYALGIDRRGKVDRVVRHFSFTAREMVEEFGAKNLSENLLEAAKRGDSRQKYEVWNIVEPHRKLAGVDEPYTLSYSKFCYRSVYWSAEAKNNGADGLLAVRGFRVRPLVAPRLSFEIGDVYGRGCGADVLGHCRALQTMSLAQLDLADQEAHPSLMAPASMADDGLRLGPWEVNYYPDGLQPDAVYRTLGDRGAKGERTSMEQARIEQEIRKAFFNSEFETISAMQDGGAQIAAQGGKMTATEVKARVGEKMEQLSGIATTLNDELLDPFVTTMASFAMLAGLTDAVLPERQGALPWDIKYESAIHAAVNAQPISALQSSLGVCAQLAQATNDGSVFDNFDPDAVARDVHRKLGAPESYLRKAKDRDELRQERAAAQQREAETQRAAIEARTLKDAMGASISPETIGGALAGAGQT